MSPSANSAVRITEPHPSVPSSHALFSGRGGAGNVVYANPKNTTPGQTASGPASRTKLTSRTGGSSSASSMYYLTGRGGAGNAFSNRERERAMFCFDEELEQQARMRENAAPIFHVGRGGAGNAVHSAASQHPYQHRDARDNASTTSGDSSAAEEDAAPSASRRHPAGVRKASVGSVASSESSGRGRGRRSIEDAWTRMVRPFSRH